MSTQRAVEVVCDCVGGPSCPDEIHDADEPCENAVMTRTHINARARLTAMTEYGYSVVPALKGTYVLADRCRACTDWSDVKAIVLVGLRAMGWAVDDLDRILAKVRDALNRGP